MNIIFNQNPCHYLFGKNTSDVFSQGIKRFSEKLILDSLTTLIKVSEYLITRKEAFFLFDPTAFNNQCHLYALMSVQRVQDCKANQLIADCVSLPKKAHRLICGYSQEVDPRFTPLALLLGYSFLTDASLLGKVIKKIPKEAIGEIPKPEKDFEVFLKDPGGERTRATRYALNALFKEYISTSFRSNSGPLYAELARIAQSPELDVPYGSEKLYTLPKFAGVACLLDMIAKRNIPLMFKVKVMTEKGTNAFHYCEADLKVAACDAPVIVFEMIAYDAAFTREKCLLVARRCPRHSEREASSKKRHDEKDACAFCSSVKVDADLYQQRYLPVLQKSSEMLYALGVAFIQERQTQFSGFFSDPQSFPLLTQLYKHHAPNVAKQALASTKADNIYVSHVFIDCALHASQEAMIMNASYEAHCHARGLI